MSADVWDDGTAYESYVGRWSRLVAAEFVGWLAVPPRSAWLDFGCGSGALAQTILGVADPQLVVGCDRSPGFIEHARRQTTDARARFELARLDDLPIGPFDASVSGLVLNFLPDAAAALSALAAVTRPSGVVAGYVWDYQQGMELMRVFWDAAVALDPAAQSLDEAVRFPQCRPGPLRRIFEDAGLGDVDVRAIDVPTVFESFDDYWRPFTGGQGPAPGYVAARSPADRDRLREAVRERLSPDADGRIRLRARAWAARGLVT